MEQMLDFASDIEVAVSWLLGLVGVLALLGLSICAVFAVMGSRH